MKKALIILLASLTLAFSGVVLGGTPMSPSTQPAEAASYRSCYTAMNGQRWCYQYNCNWFETVFQGCSDGWVVTNTWYA